MKDVTREKNGTFIKQKLILLNYFLVNFLYELKNYSYRKIKGIKILF